MELTEDDREALEIIAENYHGVKYAAAALEEGFARPLVARLDGRPVGAEIYYRIGLPQQACVHYYIAVRPPYRRMGIATALVLEAERRCGAEVGLATALEDNRAALSLFQRLSYRAVQWRALPRRLREPLLKATCGYDDDVLLIKGTLGDVQETEEVRDFWRRACLRPFLGGLRRSNVLKPGSSRSSGP